MSGLTKEPRLHFTDEERNDPVLKKPIQKAEKAAKKADRAAEKIPKKKTKKTVQDPVTGEVTTKLVFEEKKKPASKLTHAVQEAPANTVMNRVHREIRKDEDDNVGVESAHKSEEALETSTRLVKDGYRSHKMKPYRQSAKAEHRLEKANIETLYQQAIERNPQMASNPVTRWQQKQAVRKQYAAAKRTEQTATSASTVKNYAQKAARATGEKAKQSAEFVWHHKNGFGILLAVLMLVCVMLNGMSSCSMMAQGIGSALTSSTYPSKDEDMLGAEAVYAAKEAALQSFLDNYERTHHYDEYNFKLDEIGHDPYVLISILTAYHGGAWTLEEVQDTLDMLFEKQYILTEEIVRVPRPTEDPSESTEGMESTDPSETTVPQPDYFIANIELDNFNLSHVPVYIMGEDQLGMYAVYMATLGNRPDLFPVSEYPHASGHKDYLDYEVPPEALEDKQFARMLKEAEKYLGYPYVWGGTNPTTSFDCSGYISWVINHSGWDEGRLGAEALFYFCTPVSSVNAKPGDLIFFERTYDETGVTHVGMYVGDGMMIHCGDPISYEDITQPYWQQHFYSYGRLPPPTDPLP